MATHLRLAFTADLHWGINARGDDATRLLLAFLQAEPPDVLVLAGDVGAAENFAPCLELFAPLPGRKALVPGNHDVWVREDDSRGDSLRVYQDDLPRQSAAHGFHYLDQGPLLLPEADLALVGAMNWYDYSWSLDELKQFTPDWEWRLQTKRFSRGRHNDARFVRWPLTDQEFTARTVAGIDEHLRQARAAVGRSVLVTHHPPFYGLSFPRAAVTLDSLLWDAFGGNRALEQLLAQHADRVAFAFCGHTHRAREGRLDGVRGYNVGGDYHFKRLLVLDWPAGAVAAHQFGDPEA
jgi:3',5'-cyclic AMP phosphodiesterase CpdA